MKNLNIRIGMRTYCFIVLGVLFSSCRTQEDLLLLNKFNIFKEKDFMQLDFRYTPIQYMERIFKRQNSIQSDRALMLLEPVDLKQLSQCLQQIHLYYQHNRHKWGLSFYMLWPSNVSFNEQFILDQMTHFHFNVASDVYFVTGFESGSRNLSLFEMYQFVTYKVLRRIPLRSSKQIDLYDIADKTPRRANFFGDPIIGVSMENPDYDAATKYKPQNSPNDPVEFQGGFEVDEFRYIAEALNFTEVAVKGSGYISEGPNGTLLGMAQQINNGEADIKISSSEFLYYRMNGSDGLTYLQPTFINNMIVVFKQPPSSTIRSVLKQAFTGYCWFALFITICVLILAFVLALTIRIKLKFMKIPNEDLQVTKDAVIWAIGTLTQQGWHQDPVTYSGRSIFLTGFLFGLLCYTAFSAAMVSIMSIDMVAISSFSDIVFYQFRLYSDEHIPTTKYEIIGLQKELVIGVSNETVFNRPIAETLPKLTTSRSGLVTISDSFYPVLMRRSFDDESFACKQLSTVTVNGRKVKMGMLVRRNWSFREALNYKILVMLERGVKFRMQQHYLLDTSIQCPDTRNPQRQIDLADVLTAVFALVLGFSMSILVICIERSISMYSHVKTRPCPYKRNSME